MEAWDAELRSTQEFEVVTDHKNLEYFYSPRKLTERHVRWSLFLSKFNFFFTYRKGSENGCADALSRRDQDLPTDSDKRVTSRVFQLLQPKQSHGRTSLPATKLTLAPMNIEPATTTIVGPATWTEARGNDPQYLSAIKALEQGLRHFPPSLGLKLSIAECAIDPEGYLVYRKQRWVPDYEPLRTSLIQIAHESPTSGHPGRDQTYLLTSRKYFWPNMAQDIRQYIRNCDTCGRTKAWREQKRGLLKPLPIPD